MWRLSCDCYTLELFLVVEGQRSHRDGNNANKNDNVRTIRTE